MTLLIPFLLQSMAIAFDELYFHSRREIPAWERIGHPLDTLSLCGCLVWALLLPYSAAALGGYVGLATLSCLLVTKDEWVHARLCCAGEHWLHALLFVLHPIVLLSVGWIWAHAELQGAYRVVLAGFAAASGLFFIYQVIYWNLIKRAASEATINNTFYDTLGDGWYTAVDDPIALLRAEARVKNPWVIQQMEGNQIPGPASVLDIGCGAGFLANALALAGYKVSGLDQSQASLAAAGRHDVTQSVQYIEGDASRLPFENGRFDVVCSMDFLEHVDDPLGVIQEGARVLKPGGLFFFHTFNRNWVSWLLAVKGLEWVVRNAPRNIHLYRLFIRPRELTGMCERAGLEIINMIGVRPVVLTRAFFELLAMGRVDPDFKFKLTRSLLVGYLGVARKPNAQ